MTVRELIKVLNTCSDSSNVYLAGDEEVNDIHKLFIVTEDLKGKVILVPQIN